MIVGRCSHSATKTRTPDRQTAILLSQDCCRQYVLESDIVSDSILRLPPLAETAEAGVFREVISSFLFETCSTLRPELLSSR
jgi:hypothetical protein